MTLTVQSRADLWRVCLKSPHARIEIPELEFEVSVDGKKQIDSIYNHIAHVSQGPVRMPCEHNVRQEFGCVGRDCGRQGM